MAWWWQHADPPEDPRYYPAPVPTAGVFDSPLVYIQVNSQWLGHIDGLLGRLLERDAWLGSDTDVDFAVDQIQRLLAHLGDYTPVNPFFIGEVRLFAHSTLPSGWVECYGQELSRTTYVDLFTAIGTKYGAGNGTTTFNVPMFKRRFLAGFEPVPGGEFDFGHTGGEETHVLTTTEMPAHTHNVGRGNPSGSNASFTAASVQSFISNQVTSSTGGGAAHENRPPWGVVLPAIYTGV